MQYSDVLNTYISPKYLSVNYRDIEGVRTRINDTTNSPIRVAVYRNGEYMDTFQSISKTASSFMDEISPSTVAARLRDNAPAVMHGAAFTFRKVYYNE